MLVPPPVSGSATGSHSGGFGVVVVILIFGLGKVLVPALVGSPVMIKSSFSPDEEDKSSCCGSSGTWSAFVLSHGIASSSAGSSDVTASIAKILSNQKESIVKH